MANTKAEFNAIRSLAFGSISGTYANVGTALTDPAAAFRVANNTDGDLLVSLDGGVTDHLFVAAGNFVLYDIRANKRNKNQDDYVIPAQTQFAVKQVTAPTEGNIYIEVLK